MPVPRVTLPTFDWENLIPDNATRHALQDYAVQVNTILENLQEQIDELLDTDTGVPPHDLLQSDVHLDTETDAPSPGSLVVGEPADAVDLDLYWFDGLPIDYLLTEDVTSGLKYWFDGLPFDSILSLSDGDVKWVELVIGPDGYVLTSRGNRIEWAEVSALVNRIAASAYFTIDVPIASATPTTLSFTAVQFDSGPFWSSGTPSRLTVPAGQGGRFAVLARATWATGSLGSLRVSLFVNGAVVDADEAGETVDTSTPSRLAAKVVELNAGDYVEMSVYWAYVDAAPRTVTAGQVETFLQIQRVN